VVALSNTYTCYLLLQAAVATETSTFEDLSHAIGGEPFKRFAQVSNVVLLVGNLTGDMCLLADLGKKSLIKSLGDSTPSFLVSNNGQGIMLLLVLTVIFPLSLFRGMRALEHVASAGNVVVLILCGVLTYDAFANNFYGITSGEVPLWTISAKSENIAEAFALIGFSFYLHPLMMPMLQELPPGRKGVKIMRDSLNFVIMVVAMGVFTYIGVMGAAAFGDATMGDIMRNKLIPARVPSLMFALTMLVYLSSCIPPIVLSLRCYLEYMLVGPGAAFQCASPLTTVEPSGLSCADSIHVVLE
jgi:solute carrier family 38 (sodium-coupled neutral amino acid transporter), member 11